MKNYGVSVILLIQLAPLDRNNSRKILLRKIANIFLVENGQWLGYIAYHFILDEAEISHVVVNGQRQHQGIGCQLMKAFKEYVKSRDITNFLRGQRIEYISSKLYEKTGFRKVAVRKNYYKEPQENAFVMCAKLRKEAQ